MDLLLSLDRTVFLFINHLPHAYVTDGLAMFFSGIGEWGLVWFIIAVALFAREEKKHHLFFFPFILSGGLSVFFSEMIVKLVIARPRPFIEMGALILASPTNYSFPSTHATLAWSMAFILASHEPRYRILFYLLAVCISLSRIFLGVHYPSDIIGGSFLGIMIGWLSLTLNNYVRANLILSLPKRSKKIQ